MLKRRSSLGLLLYFASHVVSAAQPNAVEPARAPLASCAELTSLVISASQIGLATAGARIETATTIAASGDAATPDYVPAHCIVNGAIAPLDPKAPPIHFGVALPLAWNGMSIQIGGNGMNGFIPRLAALNRDSAGSPLGPAFPPNASFPLARGYVTYGDDSGHGGAQSPGSTSGATPQGGPPAQNNDWMSNEESRRNFGYEHIKKTHDVVSHIIDRMYGQRARIRYFAGESQGGRAALNAIARYGADYDGVLVSVPLSYFTGIHYSPLIRRIRQMQPGAWLAPAKLRTLEAETIRQCDALDGLTDGVVLNYQACNRRFDPTKTAEPLRAVRCPQGIDAGEHCLSDAQIATVNGFRSPIQIGFPLANGETDWPGEPAGSEFVSRWLTSDRVPTHEQMRARSAGLAALLGVRDFDAAHFDWQRYRAHIQALSELIDAPADWTRFLQKGGKVIFHSAANDYVTNPRGHFRLYEMVARKAGETLMERGVRFYVTPAADHGSRGYSFPEKKPQPRHVDLLEPLLQWVERGNAPADALTQALIELKPPYTVHSTRPLCRYPAYPHYVGKGSAAAAASYQCTTQADAQ